MPRKNNRNRKNGPRRDIVREFSVYFGDEGKLENWQRLCRDPGLHGEFTSLTRCRKALRTVCVNIWDLLDAIQAGTAVPRFPNKHALAQYTIEEERFYPKKQAKKQGPVKDLLKHIV
ncbi:hypothetical protein PVAG01_09285 [Phlyctema vagabunda]|uniref:Uncharacterized protein n=1 Tax=Phlyctema vagabunda TaxID=108571 RepID=A0ABR4P6W8_9HELO